MPITKLFLTVLGAFVRGTSIDESVKPHFTVEVLEKLFKLSKAHDVVQIVSDVLFKNGLLPENEPITVKYQEHQLNALGRYMTIEHEQQMMYCVLEKNEIEFIPLKGSVLREYYPDPYMRTSCDIDILVRMEDLQKAISALVSELNYKSSDIIGFHDVALYSPSEIHIELHHNLKEKRENLDKVLVTVWDSCIDSPNGKFQKLESPEFYIFHHIAHMVNHFLRGGCGIRPFVDLYFIEKSMKYDKTKLLSLMKESGVDVFYATALQCVGAWFGDADSAEVVDLMENFILKGGVYGTKENRTSIERNVQGGKFKYFLYRIFIPYDKLKYKYPVLEKYKILLPLIWLIRPFSLLLPNKRKRAQMDLQFIKQTSDTAETQTAKMLKMLEI